MDRRTFIASAAVVPIAGSAMPLPVDPIVGWVKSWRKAYNEYLEAEEADGGGNFDCPACVEAQARYREYEHLICATQATTLEGLAAQFSYFQEDLGYFVTENLSEPYSGIIAKIQNGLDQLVA